MRAHLQSLIGERSQTHSFHMNDAVLILQWAFSLNELSACDDQPLTFIQIRRNDDIGNSCLVFHRQEDEAHRWSGALPRNDHPCSLHIVAVFECPQIFGGRYPVPAECIPAICHRVLSNRQPCPCVIRDEAFFGGHLLQGEARGLLAENMTLVSEQRSFHFPGSLYLPKRITTMFDSIETVQGTHPSENREFFPIQRGDSRDEILSRAECTRISPRFDQCLRSLVPPAAGL